MIDFFADAITSRRNARVLTAVSLRQDAGTRRRAGAFLAEGIKVVAAALAAGAAPATVFVSPRLLTLAGGSSLLSALRRRSSPLVAVTDGIMDLLTDTRTPQGVTAMMSLPRSATAPPAPRPGWPLLVTWCVQDPGNLGAMMRAAAALGVSGMVAAGGGADPYHPRAVRAAAGALFRLTPVILPPAASLAESLRGAGHEILAASPRGGVAPSRLSWSRPWALLMGGEGSGLPTELLRHATETISIPMEEHSESLSVPVAAAILLAEARRARDHSRTSPRPGRPRAAAKERPARLQNPGRRGRGGRGAR